MSQGTTPTTGRSDGSRDVHYDDRSRRLSTETKSSVKTTELIAYVAAVAGVLIASAIADAEDFGTYDAWRLVTYLTIGYMIARGLAKAGSSQPYDE